MTKCWRDEPNLRPSFEKLRNKLREMENQHKVELKSLQRLSLFPFFSFENFNVWVYFTSRVVFNWVPKIVLNCFDLLSLLCNWSRKLAPPSQPTNAKLQPISTFVSHVFPRLKQVAWFYCEFSLVDDDVNLRFDWWLWLLEGSV